MFGSEHTNNILNITLCDLLHERAMEAISNAMRNSINQELSQAAERVEAGRKMTTDRGTAVALNAASIVIHLCRLGIRRTNDGPAVEHQLRILAEYLAKIEDRTMRYHTDLRRVIDAAAGVTLH